MNPTFLALKLFETAARKDRGEGGRELNRVYWLSLQQKIPLGRDGYFEGGGDSLVCQAQLGR